MTRLLFTALLAAAGVWTLPAHAQSADKCVTDIRGNQVCGAQAGQCTLDRYRNAWCAPAGGRTMTDRYGEVVCGAGACVTDINGNIQCAATPGGAVSTSPAGQQACAGGCVPASQSQCQRMTPR